MRWWDELVQGRRERQAEALMAHCFERRKRGVALSDFAHHRGVRPGEAATAIGLTLSEDELLLHILHGAALIEEVTERGDRVTHRTGGSSYWGMGMSTSSSTSVTTQLPDREVDRVLDVGRVAVTTERIIFLGRRKSREFRLVKLLQRRWERRYGEATVWLGVSNSMKMSGLRMSSAVDAQWFDLAHLKAVYMRTQDRTSIEQWFRDATVDVRRIEAQVAALRQGSRAPLAHAELRALLSG